VIDHRVRDVIAWRRIDDAERRIEQLHAAPG
jgi:hypothetical protein